MERKADIDIEQVITFILIAVGLILIIILIVGLKGNVFDLGDSIKNLLGRLF